VKTKLVIAFHVISAILISAFVSPPVIAQSAPGANQDLALLSIDLQTSRNSAASLQAQAEEKRKLKALAAKEIQAAAPNEVEEPSRESPELAAAIPTGGGLIPARIKTIVAKAAPRQDSIEPVPRTDSN
jgi:hypothetical protein